MTYTIDQLAFVSRTILAALDQNPQLVRAAQNLIGTDVFNSIYSREKALLAEYDRRNTPEPTAEVAKKTASKPVKKSKYKGYSGQVYDFLASIKSPQGIDQIVRATNVPRNNVTTALRDHARLGHGVTQNWDGRWQVR